MQNSKNNLIAADLAAAARAVSPAIASVKVKYGAYGRLNIRSRVRLSGGELVRANAWGRTPSSAMAAFRRRLLSQNIELASA